MDISLFQNPFQTNLDALDRAGGAGAMGAPALPKEKIHVRMQDQKNRKLTLIEGMDDDLDLKRIAKALKKAFSCSTAVQYDKKTDREVILIQGDHRMAVKEWLLFQQILTEKEAKERLVLHGF